MSLHDTLRAGIEQLGLTLPVGAEERLLAYLALLTKWNKVYNLTAIRQADEMLTHHVLDSLSVLPHLDGVNRLLDVGSGGGLPGIVLAIARPDLDIVSVETVAKKASFQLQARIELGLSRFSVLNRRVEDIRDDAGFDGIISRAFAEMALFVRLTRHLLAPGGHWFAMKGVHPAGELADLPAGVALCDEHVLQVPGLDAQRHLLILADHAAA